MKNTISKCFAIILFTITIFSMFLMVLCAADTMPIFFAFGGLCIGLVGLSLLGLWLSCAVILFTTVKEAVKAGEGLSKMFQNFIGKIA